MKHNFDASLPHIYIACIGFSVATYTLDWGGKSARGVTQRSLVSFEVFAPNSISVANNVRANF